MITCMQLLLPFKTCSVTIEFNAPAILAMKGTVPTETGQTIQLFNLPRPPVQPLANDEVDQFAKDEATNMHWWLLFHNSQCVRRITGTG